MLVTLNSDNAAMFDIDLADEYINVRDAFGCSLDELEDFSLAAIAASWADDSTKREMHRDFVDEMADLRTAHGVQPRGAGLPRDGAAP